jgi:hypothetical protein
MNKKISILVLVLLSSLTACKQKKQIQEQTGNDRDKHGCINSAGYTWSQIKNSCVRIFTDGTKFTAYGNNTDSSLAAFLIVSEDKKKAELFVPAKYSSEAILLDARTYSTTDSMPTLFENKQKEVKLEFLKNKYIISIKNEGIFSQNFSKNEGLGKLLEE